MLVKSVKDKDIEHLRQQFEEIDVNHTGLIDADELANAIKRIKMDIPQSEIDEIMNEVNFLGNGEINYSEFIAATLSVKSILTNEKLYALFKELDHEGIDVLTS